jgi:dipeptidyl aminopeptidase/acylaminoacyl peptidase
MPAGVPGRLSPGLLELRSRYALGVFRMFSGLFWAACLAAQQSPGDIARILEQRPCAESSGVRICHYDYVVGGAAVEAISFVPAGAGPFPAALLIPGFERTARDLIALGTRLASAGIAAVAVSQPGFGKSAGPADYVGPKTLNVLTVAFRRLQKEPFVDAKRMGIYGYSRGGMAASLLAVELDDVKAAVFGAGVYDFQRMYDEAKLPGIRQNMKHETGMTPEAVRVRSSVLRMDKLRCPVLILHGEDDKNVPVSQAKLLAKRLEELHKEFDLRLFPGREHGIGPEVGELTLEFFKRRL